VPDGRAAVTGYRVRERFNGWSLLELDLVTGRTHQIRVHLASIGHPILGDATYGAGRGNQAKEPLRTALRALHRPALHAASLVFDHPSTGERLRFESPLPPDLERLLGTLRQRAEAGRE
jgi:23S rRNA pseudouridine1911/1915/1917 synthase